VTQEGNFGKPLGRFGVKNPIMSPGRSLGGNKTWTTLNNVNAGTGTYSSTNVGSYIYLFSGNIVTVGYGFTALQVLAQAQLRHSGAPASVDFLFFMDYGNGTGTGVYGPYSLSETIPSATRYKTLTLSRTFPLDTVGASQAPGLHTIGLVVRNNTAGTLDMGAAGASGTMNFIDTMEVSWKAANA